MRNIYGSGAGDAEGHAECVKNEGKCRDAEAEMKNARVRRNGNATNGDKNA